jgi:hypothetical protein
LDRCLLLVSREALGAGHASSARKAIESQEKIAFHEERKFDFNLTFMTRALVATVTGRALFELIHPRAYAELQAGWLVYLLPMHVVVRVKSYIVQQ